MTSATRRISRLYRAGELTPIRIPSEAEERVRDVVRCRATFQHEILTSRHYLLKFLARRGDNRNASGAARVLRGRLYGASTQDPATLPTAVAVMLGAAVVATFAPAMRAIRVPPARAPTRLPCLVVKAGREYDPEALMMSVEGKRGRHCRLGSDTLAAEQGGEQAHRADER